MATNPPRVETYEERMAMPKQRAQIGSHFVCGCGDELWILLKNGDCVCANCMHSQARIIVNELKPVGEKRE